MKVKIEVKSRNNYPPPSHTPQEGEGAYSTYIAPKDNYSWMRNCSMGPLNTKILIVSKNKPIWITQNHMVSMATHWAL